MSVTHSANLAQREMSNEDFNQVASKGHWKAILNFIDEPGKLPIHVPLP